MAFAPTPLLPGDAFEAALRFAEAVDQEWSRLVEPADRAACLGRRWTELLELGWAATLVEEAAGGAGGSLADLAALLDGAGRTALPLPLASACGVVPLLLRQAADTALLADAASGQFRPCAVLAAAVPHGEAGPILAREQAGQWLLHGSALGVETPPAATHYLVVCALGEADETGLLLLPAAGLEATLHERIDGRLTVDLELRGAPATLLAHGEAVRQQAAAANDLGALLTCVEAVSAMGALIAQTIAYLSQRQQFGTVLGSFQALRHRVAEMYVAYENTRGLVLHLLRQPAPPWRDIAFAKLRLGEAGRFVAEQAIQVHGGMGMTEELPATRLARRILMAEFEYGDRHWQAARLLHA